MPVRNFQPHSPGPCESQELSKYLQRKPALSLKSLKVLICLSSSMLVKALLVSPFPSQDPLREPSLILSLGPESTNGPRAKTSCQSSSYLGTISLSLEL